MVITEETTYEEFKPLEAYLKDGEKEKIEKASVDKYGDFWGMKIGNLFKFIKGDFSPIGFSENPSVYQVYYRMKFSTWFVEFTETVTNLVPPQSIDSKKAQSGTLQMTFQESVLIFMREYFGLHSFGEVEEMPVIDYIVAKKDKYNQAVFTASLAKINRKK